jgi:uncharacterized protein (UPF0332 family)
MQGEGFFAVADYLLKNPPPKWQEASDRTAVSRIYYAAFIYSRDLMEKWGCQFTDGVVHAQVAEGLKASDQSELVRIGCKIANLHGERKRADYQTKTVQGFSFDKIKQLYEDVVPELQRRWEHLNGRQRSEALAKIRARIESV